MGRGLEKRRKGVFCGADLEAIVGFSVVVVYFEDWGRAAPVFVGFLGWGLAVFEVEKRGGGVARRVEGGEGFDFGFGGGLDEFLAEVKTEQGRGEAERMGDGAVRQAEFGEGKDKRARVFDH
jgi:hypothetical protein